jgi:hypothetical protein
VSSAILIYRNFEALPGVFLGMAALVYNFLGTSLLHWYIGLSRFGALMFL